MPVVTGNVEILHRAQMGQDVYIYGIRTYQTYIYIYTYRQFSVYTTSVGLAALAPIIHRPEEALDIQSELIFVNGMINVPQE